MSQKSSQRNNAARFSNLCQSFLFRKHTNRCAAGYFCEALIPPNEGNFFTKRSQFLAGPSSRVLADNNKLHVHLIYFYCNTGWKNNSPALTEGSLINKYKVNSLFTSNETFIQHIVKRKLHKNKNLHKLLLELSKAKSNMKEFLLKNVSVLINVFS